MNVSAPHHDGEQTLTLEGKTAADLMTPAVVSISPTATIREAVALLTEKNLSALAVVGPNGRPVGVLSRTDIVAHDSQCYEALQPGKEFYEKNDFVTRIGEAEANVYCFERPRATEVWEVMNPVIFSVGPGTAAALVIDAMLTLMVHRVFVQDDDGSLVAVVSATDVLRHLRAGGGPQARG